MKKLIWTLIPLFTLILLISLGASKDVTDGPEFPSEVAGILETSCYTCHTTGAKSEDALDALDFLKWDDLRKSKKVGLLSDIEDVLREGQMPPERYLKKYPDKALSEKDKKALLKWAKAESEAIMAE